MVLLHYMISPKERRFALVMISMNLFCFTSELPYSALTITYDILGLAYFG